MKIDVRKLEREVALRGWDYQHLAVKASLSPGTVTRVLAGQDARIWTLRKIARALTDAPIAPGMDLLLEDERLVPGQWRLTRPDGSSRVGFGEPPSLEEGDRLDWLYGKDRDRGTESRR